MSETDIIGGFPYVDPNCNGCGQTLILGNAWMTDGCPCNYRLGVNSNNETRWRLLMQLQQRQGADLAAARQEIERLRAASDSLRRQLAAERGRNCQPDDGSTEI